MVPSTCQLTVLPDGQTGEVRTGATVRDALAQLGVDVIAPCGGEGTCGKCRVQATGDLAPPTREEVALFTSAQLASGLRLACQAQIQGRVEVTVPASSRPAAMRIVLEGTARDVPVAPAVTKKAVSMPPQTLAEPYARVEHLRRCGELDPHLHAGLGLLQRLPAIFDAAGGQVTAVMRDQVLLDVEPGDTSGQCLGVALDLGTTTVVASLVDLNSGRELAHAATVNQQVRFGHDVVARINATLEAGDGLARVRDAARQSLAQVVAEVVAKAGVAASDVYEAVLVGNATMLHLALGISPASLGHLPYIATVGDPVVAPAAELGLALHPAACLYALPNIAGFVGADTVGAILAAGLDEDDGRVRVLADIGTNCEIALRLGPRLLVTSTPAGPAFEGARIACGMYAAPGAIEKVRIEGQVRCRTIAGEPARGLCGSGLVDATAELLRLGIVDMTGRLVDTDELDSALPAAVSERLVARDDGNAFHLTPPGAGQPVFLSQRDVRELQLAKAAIRTGIDLLLEHAGVRPEAVDELCLAGGFGSYIDKTHAMRLGLIPTLPSDRLSYIGNGALVGARLALVSGAMRQRGNQVARQAEHLQLAHTPDFQQRFSEAMLFE